MDVFEALAQRHSYRGPFEVGTVARHDLRRIVEAALQAPSGKNAQTTTFVVVDDADLLDAIHAMPGANTALQQARALIACVVDRRPEAIYEGHAFQVEDCAAAVENMLLAVTALGYATVWIDGWLRVEGRAETLGRMLSVPEGKMIRVVLPLGVPVERHAPKPKKPFDARAAFNRHPA